ncbi:MAG: nucleotidyltransferase domain-containing protein [Pseudomonadota bacterium]|jgi:predicted nucleotidyltransferase|nr:nucleotidyltransferase domain-containing protein [Pseudomonadota bacterium]|tara:strand:+ start:1571 stop:2506 length:936 start_codon:yes stop_codon:yes gene_type:complete
MRIRPKDFIAIDNKLFFAVVCGYQEDNHVLTFLRYIKDNAGMHKLTTKKAEKIIRESYPEFQFNSSYIDVKLHGIPIDMIKKIYYPEETVKKLLNTKIPDDKKRDAIDAIKYLQSIGCKTGNIGITGSIMLGTYNECSDIDVIIYGREVFLKIRKHIKNSLAIGELNPLNQVMWKDAYERRDCSLSFNDFYSHEIRKFNKFISGNSKVDISAIPNKDEKHKESGPYKKIGKDKILSTVMDDSYAYDFPARYSIKHDNIKEVISYTGTYTGQARKGERIEAVGFVEQDKEGVYRLLVGTSREAKGEYIRVID